MSERILNFIEPQPETQKFKEEMLDPQYMEEGEVRYGIFLLNRDLAGKDVNPVVINLAHGEEASVGAGRFDLNAFAQTIARPLVAIDMPGMGTSSWLKRDYRRGATFDQLARNHLNIIDHLGINDFDLVGNSMGGIMAIKIAGIAGSRAKHLITLSAPSLEGRSKLQIILRDHRQNKRDFEATLASAPAAIRVEAEAAAAHKRQNSNNRMRTARTVLEYARLLAGVSLLGVQDKIDPSTKWVDVTGDQDTFSDWSVHKDVVERRNQLYPGTSRFEIQKGESHAWQAYYRWEVAALAAKELDT